MLNIQVSRGSNSSFESLEVNKKVSKGLPQISVQHEGTGCALNHSSHMSTMPANESHDLLGEPAEASTSQRSVDVPNAPGHTVRRPAVRVRSRVSIAISFYFIKLTFSKSCLGLFGMTLIF